jgi:tetratricopeptide (TPR) repeat protein
MNPNDVVARHCLAVYHERSGDLAAARNLHSENLAKHPPFFPAQMHLGELARLEGEWEESIRHHSKLLEYDPQHSYSLKFLARTYMDLGDLDEARRTLARARPVDRASFSARALEALMLAQEKRQGEAGQAMDGELLRYLELNGFWTLAGAEFHALMGNRPRALEWLERAVRQGDERTGWFARDPALKSIRGDSRFHQIVASVAARRAAAVPR